MLDTLKYSKQLQQAGVTREQADAQAEALHEAVSESVATRAQLESVGQELVGRIDHAAQRLDTKIETVAQRLDAKIEGVDLKPSAEIRQLRWMMGVLVALNAAILVKLLLI